MSARTVQLLLKYTGVVPFLRSCTAIALLYRSPDDETVLSCHHSNSFILDPIFYSQECKNDINCHGNALWMLCYCTRMTIDIIVFVVCDHLGNLCVMLYKCLILYIINSIPYKCYTHQLHSLTPLEKYNIQKTF